MEATVTCVVYWHGCHLFNWWHHQTNLSFGSISVLFLLFLEDICRTSSLLSIVEGLRTMMGKCQGWFFWSCWPNFWSRRTRSMSSGRDNSHDQMCSRSCQMWSKPGRLFVKSLWTHVQPLCGSQPSNKKRFRWVTENENPQTANMFRLFDSCGYWLVVHLMWFMTNFCSSRVACIIWGSHMWARLSSHVTPAPSSPLWTLLHSAVPKQTPHRGERQRNDAAPRCWSWGVIGGGPFGYSLKRSVFAARGGLWCFDVVCLDRMTVSEVVQQFVLGLGHNSRSPSQSGLFPHYQLWMDAPVV